MDNLSYFYTANTNKLLKVEDAGNGIYGFKNGVNLTTEYTYDLNGNMNRDLNKGIGTTTTEGITYNHLNLPTQVTIGTGNIQYIYDATGIKQRKIVSSGTTTDYAGNYIYQGGTLQFFSHPEGYVENNSGTYKYHYQYKDHLGNIRVSYTNNGTAASPSVVIAEENNYYPFGLRHKGYNDNPIPHGNTAAKKYKFNGKELQDDIIGGTNLDWYDFHARNYDAALGRWMNLDPLAEQMRRHSPYNFAFNNPMRFTDPDGMAPSDHWQLNTQGKLEMIKKTNDNFNVFFDENGNKLFQTNQQSNEMTSKTWEGKTDEYINSMKSVFIEIANEPAVFNQMADRAQETGFDEKYVSISQMKDVGEKYKKIGPYLATMDLVKEAPKWGVGYAYSGAKSLFGIGTQAVKSTYTAAAGTELAKDAKNLFNQALENSKTFMSDLKREVNNGISALSHGRFGN